MRSNKEVELSNMTDSELAGLMSDMRQESSRRNKQLKSPNMNTMLRSRWVVALLLLCVAFFVLFKAETSGISKDVDKESEEKLAKPGEKGAWLMDPDDDTHGETPEEVPFTADALATVKPAETPATPSASSLGSDVPAKATDEAKKAAFAAGTRPKVKYQYKRRSLLQDDNKKAELAQKWGSWTLVDTKKNERPTEDFAKGFPHRDIPWEQFPNSAWQTDQEYLSKFLPEAKDLVERAMEAMLAEYGWSKFDLPEQDFMTRVDGGSFKTEILNLTEQSFQQGKQFVGQSLGGWVSDSYFNGLVRRLMHALITDDTFTLVMGGHSAAAGHGNHFQQSYTLQFFKVMEPIFARLGIKLTALNHGYGGLGTGQSAMGAGDIYGKEIDIIVWDSSMTENNGGAYDLFVRQVLMSGNRIPVILGGLNGAMSTLHETIDAELGNFGTGIDGVPEVTGAKMADKIIWAARYVKCTAEMHSFCREMEYNGTCWIEREDYTPETNQNKVPSGRASWHPGFKFHALKGRIIAFMVLRALHEGLKQWDEAPDKRLPEEIWHVTDHYEHIRTKLMNVKQDDSDEGAHCYGYQDLMPKSYFCSTPFNAVSEMTPRAYPRETAIRNIMKPAYDGYLPIPMENVYDPPDVLNPALHVPEGEFDYLAVVENGVDYPEFLAFDNSPLPAGFESKNKLIPLGIDKIKPGLGWSADSNANPDECDGSYDGFCGRGIDNNCLLYGHNDHRGGLDFDSFSGWGVFTVPNVKLGYIIVRLEWWHKGDLNLRTQDWEKENNGDEAYGRRLALTNSTTARPVPRLSEPKQSREQTERKLGGQELCDTFKFQMAVNGQITAYNKAQFMEKLHAIQRVVQVLTVLEDTTLTNGEPHDVEIALRISGCEHTNMFKLSHIYWA